MNSTCFFLLCKKCGYQNILSVHILHCGSRFISSGEYFLEYSRAWRSLIWCVSVSSPGWELERQAMFHMPLFPPAQRSIADKGNLGSVIFPEADLTMSITAQQQLYLPLTSFNHFLLTLGEGKILQCPAHLSARWSPSVPRATCLLSHLLLPQGLCTCHSLC